MRRGQGPIQTSGAVEPARASATGVASVNQSQGFDTSAFSIRSASPSAAAVEAPQPSACESSPKPQRRRTSGSGGGTSAGIDAGSSGSSSSNSLRRSLELDRQQQSSAFAPFSAGMDEGRGKSSSGPINSQQQQQQSHHQQPQQQSQAQPPGVTSPVRRTRSLKENLIKRFNSSVVGGAAGIARAAGVTAVSPAPSEDSPKSFPPAPGEEAFSFDLRHAALTPRTPTATAGGSRSSSPKKALEAAAKQQQQQPAQMTRNRAGSLRSGSVVKVLPDKKLLNKASSSENLSNQNAAAADLNSLASLVQKKRDRSQESLEQARVGGGSGGGGGTVSSRKPPTPTPMAGVDSDDGSEPAAAKSKPPSGMSRGSTVRRLESPTGRVVAVAVPLLSACAATDDSPAEANDTDRESPGEDQPSDGEVAAQGGNVHDRSSSLEFLMQDAQSRTAPQIRHPSARKIEYNSTAPAAAAAARREGSPSKILGGGGSSPPKAVSFNPNDEIKTYEGGEYHSRYKKHHRSGSSSHSLRQQQQQQQRLQQRVAAVEVGGDRNGHGEVWSHGRIGDNALIEVHGAMVESMDKMVAKQRQFLSQVKEGSITVSEYREVMKSLLTMQTKTIHQILDAIQSNEKPS